MTLFSVALLCFSGFEVVKLSLAEKKEKGGTILSECTLTTVQCSILQL